MEQARALITKKENIEAEIDAQISVLKANSSTLQSPLVDQDGFPRADIDIYAVRRARVRIIELRNDLDAVMNAIAKALEGIYDPSLQIEGDEETNSPDLKPFAKLNGVAPGSPAAEAGLQREDLLLKFGQLDYRSFSPPSLQPLADLAASSENRHISIKVLRSAQTVFLTLTPRKWDGRGTLGCHIVPYSSSS